jgi:LysM repeat protein
MEKTPTDISTDGSVISTSTSTTETRTLRDVVHSSKRTGGNYGSLAKSQIQPIFYISHKVESDDTLQRLSLKYSINVCLCFLNNK